MPNSVLTAVVDDKIWSLDRPVWFGGVRLRARTTVVRLDDGSLLLHTPAPPTDALAEQLRALGPVRWLVVPNCWHHLGAPAAAAHFPEAQVVGPASALEQEQGVETPRGYPRRSFRRAGSRVRGLAASGRAVLGRNGALPSANANPAGRGHRLFRERQRSLDLGVVPRALPAVTSGCEYLRTPERRFRTRPRRLAPSKPCWSDRPNGSSSGTATSSKKVAVTAWHKRGN